MGRNDVLLGVCSMLIMFGCDSPPSWTSVKEMVRRDFPEVQHVSADELAEELESDAAPVLLDVREQAEYDVSHLPGAIRVQPGTDASDLDLDPDAPVVAYCSVGYRSSQLVRKLKERGFTDVRNLEGSIFEWANEGHPVERDGKQVHEVHPYDEEWGQLLDENLRAYEPGAK